MATVPTLLVFCASGSGTLPAYTQAAAEFGRLCAAASVPLIYGAGKVGLMGALADACLRGGGSLTGVIPRFMVERGWCHPRLTRLIVTSTLAERKQTMFRLSRGIVALPGGCGTFDELLEAITMRQLGLYDHPVVILNTSGYFDSLLLQLERAVADGFMSSQVHVLPADTLWSVVSTAAEALARFLSGTPDHVAEPRR